MFHSLCGCSHCDYQYRYDRQYFNVMGVVQEKRVIQKTQGCPLVHGNSRKTNLGERYLQIWGKPDIGKIQAYMEIQEKQNIGNIRGVPRNSVTTKHRKNSGTRHTGKTGPWKKSGVSRNFNKKLQTSGYPENSGKTNISEKLHILDF